MNPKFKPSPGAQPKWEDRFGFQHESVDIKIQQEAGSTLYNEYTYVRISASNSNGLFESFGASPSHTYWALRPFIITEYSSVLVDDNVYDFYIETIDKINGPSYLQVVNSYTLINSFSIDSNVLSKLSVSISNFWTDALTTLDGSYIPTILRIQGMIDPLEVEGIS